MVFDESMEVSDLIPYHRSSKNFCDGNICTHLNMQANRSEDKLTNKSNTFTGKKEICQNGKANWNISYWHFHFDFLRLFFFHGINC